MKKRVWNCYKSGCKEIEVTHYFDEELSSDKIPEGWNKIIFNDGDPVIYCAKHLVRLEVRDRVIRKPVRKEEEKGIGN